MYYTMEYLLVKARVATSKWIKDESGMGTIEMVVLIVILLGLAFLFRDAITEFVEKLLAKITESADKLDI